MSRMDALLTTKGNSPRRRGCPFPKGNAGQKRGSKNRTTLVAEAVLRGDEAELVRKAIDLAKSGDGPMLKFLLDRILPKERSIQIELPAIDSASDAVLALRSIFEAVASGRITPSEAAALASLLADYARAKNVGELEERLEDTEQRLDAILGENADGSKSAKKN
jgi:hypothetical protein